MGFVSLTHYNSGSESGPLSSLSAFSPRESKLPAEGLVQQRFFELVQRGELALVEGFETLRSRHEPRIVLNGLQALIDGEGVKDPNPFARMPQERECELAVAEVFHPRKLRLE